MTDRFFAFSEDEEDGVVLAHFAEKQRLPYASFEHKQPSPKKWLDCLWRMRRPARVKKTSALEEWLGYYRNLYVAHGPDPVVYKRLLRRNGAWNVPNPYREGHPDHYAYCSDGVFLKDIDFLLERWQSKWQQLRSPQTQDLSPPPLAADPVQAATARIANEWPKLYRHRPHMMPGLSIAMTEMANAQTWHKQQAYWARRAVACLVILFEDELPMWEWIKEVMHPDNIRLLCKIVYDGAPSHQRQNLLARWTTAKWLNANDLKWFAASIPS